MQFINTTFDSEVWSARAFEADLSKGSNEINKTEEMLTTYLSTLKLGPFLKLGANSCSWLAGPH